jgi:hypothetical protein
MIAMSIEWIQSNGGSLLTGLFALWALEISRQSRNVAKQANQMSEDSELRARYESLAVRRLLFFDDLNRDREVMLSIVLRMEDLLTKRVEYQERFDNLLDDMKQSDYENEQEIELARESVSKPIELENVIAVCKEANDEYYSQMSELPIMTRLSTEALRCADIIDLENKTDELFRGQKLNRATAETLKHTLESRFAQQRKFEGNIEFLESSVAEHIAKKELEDGVQAAIRCMVRRKKPKYF